MTELSTSLVARFFVEGRARTKGHLTPLVTRNGAGQMKVVNQDRAELKAWLVDLIRGIREQNGIREVKRGRRVVGVQPPWPHAGPVVVNCDFYFERQLSVRDGELTNLPIPTHDMVHPTAADIGDVDTLARAVLDALTQSGCLKDDRLVVALHARKWWSLAGKTGVLCTVEPA